MFWNKKKEFKKVDVRKLREDEIGVITIPDATNEQLKEFKKIIRKGIEDNKEYVLVGGDVNINIYRMKKDKLSIKE